MRGCSCSVMHAFDLRFYAGDVARYLIVLGFVFFFQAEDGIRDRKSTRLNSCHDQISYAVFCLKKKKKPKCSFASRRAASTSSARAAITLRRISSKLPPHPIAQRFYPSCTTPSTSP